MRERAEGRANKKSSLFPNKDDVCFVLNAIHYKNTASVFCSDSSSSFESLSKSKKESKDDYIYDSRLLTFFRGSHFSNTVIRLG